MKLSRIELSGFKSFADPVELQFDGGVTAVVGPNGCGKSNISDAVRWVLGEQRARLLRSSRMDEVIFQGSVKRHPVNLAEVSLVFDNSDGVLPIAFQEVAITRRLSRNGQSDYFINQAAVRLRDVMDLLSGTGLGSDAGVVMEAQMIERLLSDRPDERRSLFEEAAGIGLYRDRKEATERRLERTSADLQRLDDVIAEVQTQVRSLARQRGKTERHRQFLEERFAVALTLARRELDGLAAQHASLQRQCEILRERLPEARRVLAEQEKARGVRGQERSAAEARRAELERRLGEVRLEMGRLDGDLNLAGERLQHAAERRAKAIEERTQAEVQVDQLERELESAAAERTAAATARESVQTELDLRAATEGEARQRLESQRTALRRTEEALQRRAEARRALSGEQSALQRDLDDLRREETVLTERVAEAGRELQGARAAVSSVRALLAEREREEREAGAELERARHTLAAAREHEAAVRVERREVEERIAQLGARREVVADLERRREGLTPGARELLREASRFGPGAVLGTLSDFVTISTGQARLAERLLGEWLQAVLVRDEAVVADVRAWHAAANPGPVVLLPVQPGPVSTGGAGTALACEITDPARAWVTALLRSATAGDADGAVIRRANGAVFLPGLSGPGPLSRRAELDQLAHDLDRAQVRLADLTRAGEAAAAAHLAAERGLEAATEGNARARAVVRDAQGAADDASRRLLRAEREHAEAEQSTQRIAARIRERQARLHAIGEEMAAADEERSRLLDDLAAQQSALRDLESAQEAARERRVHWQVEEVQVSAREQAAAEREGRARLTHDEAARRIQALVQELGEIERASLALTEQRSQWGDRLAERQLAEQQLAGAVEAAAAAVALADATLTESDAAVEHARAIAERVGEDLHRSELELSEADGRQRAIVERIEAEWHKPIAALLAEAPPVEGDAAFLQAEAERLAAELERIGPVNPLAVEEHAQEAKRLDFLETQRDDLVAARDALHQALREIDVTARAMFVETFAAVRENFHRVFHRLFEGGECDVRLADESDPLGSDIVIQASPRGKRVQRIHLLSTGERAFVSTALLFAIFLTKPAPFCLLDEVDAPLDDTNVMRFVRLLEELKVDTQFIVITHNPRTMQVADAVYGVTMQEPGVSTIVGVRLGEVGSTAA